MKLLFISFIIVIISTSLSLGAETATVITKQDNIRESCRFYSPVKATVHYNDVVEIISKEGDWYRVKFKKVQGCIHKSAVEKSSISLSNLVGSEKQSASGDEVALAGKGFNPQVEAVYKKENPNLDYRAVNRVENFKVSENKLRQFIQSGRLNLQ